MNRVSESTARTRSLFPDWREAGLAVLLAGAGIFLSPTAGGFTSAMAFHPLAWTLPLAAGLFSPVGFALVTGVSILSTLFMAEPVPALFFCLEGACLRLLLTPRRSLFRSGFLFWLAAGPFLIILFRLAAAPLPLAVDSAGFWLAGNLVLLLALQAVGQWILPARFFPNGPFTEKPEDRLDIGLVAGSLAIFPPYLLWALIRTAAIPVPAIPGAWTGNFLAVPGCLPLAAIYLIVLVDAKVRKALSASLEALAAALHPMQSDPATPIPGPDLAKMPASLVAVLTGIQSITTRLNLKSADLQATLAEEQELGRQLKELSQSLEVKVHQRTQELEANAAMLQAVNYSLNYSNRVMNAVLNALEDAVLLLDEKFTVLKVNQNLHRFFALSGKDLVGLDILDFFTIVRHRFADERAAFQWVKRIMSEPAGVLCTELALRDEPEHVLLFSAPVRDDQGVLFSHLLAFRDISSARRTESELKQKNRELESFVQTISHDLKNPIAVIAGVSELMQDQFKPFLDKDGAEYIRMVQAETRKMQTMIEDILQIAQVENGFQELEQVDTLAMVNEIVAEFQHIYRDVPTVFIIQESLPVVSANATMLVQVFKNLVSNSIKYSDPAKERTVVEIGYRADNSIHCFSVRDNGVGMSPEDQAHFFEMFFRAGGKDVEGTGLGASIVKKIIEAHGGRVSVVSDPGAGTTVTFTLP